MSKSSVDIKHSVNHYSITIEDVDKATWLDGVKIYWDMNRDDRPSEFTPSDHFDGYDHAISQLDDLARRYPLNEVPDIIVNNLKTLQQLSQLYEDYKNHVLGLILKPPKFKTKEKNK